jgi:hypothetical protein
MHARYNFQIPPNGESTLEQMYEREPVRAAQRIVSDLIELRDKIKTTAEGFAILDFVQGYVATDLPAATAHDIIEVIRDDRSMQPTGYPNDLVLLWLENYRRAYSQMVIRVLENASDQTTA